MPFVLINKARMPSRIPGRPSEAYAIADKFFGGLARALKANMNEVVNRQGAQDLARAIKSRDLTLSLRLIPGPYDTASGQNGIKRAQLALSNTQTKVLLASGKKALAELQIKESLDLLNNRSVTFLQDNAQKLGANIINSSAENVMRLITSSFTEGIPVDKLASLLKPHIGLHPRDANAVRRRLQAALDQGIKADFAVKQAERYSMQLLEQRAMRIARTEVIRAESEGLQVGWGEAKNAGFLDADAQQVWISGKESAGVCLLCSPLDNVKVKLGGTWDNGRGGTVSGPPLHVACRCSIAIAA
jgi:hypothetical protein